MCPAVTTYWLSWGSSEVLTSTLWPRTNPKWLLNLEIVGGKKSLKSLNCYRSAQPIWKVPTTECKSISRFLFDKTLSWQFCELCGKTVEASRWPSSRFHHTYWLLPGLILHIMAVSITDLVSFIASNFCHIWWLFLLSGMPLASPSYNDNEHRNCI